MEGGLLPFLPPVATSMLLGKDKIKFEIENNEQHGKPNEIKQWEGDGWSIGN